MDIFELQVILNLINDLSGPIQKPLEDLAELEEAAHRVDKGMEQMEMGAELFGAGGLIAAPIALATNESIKFESAMSDVKKVVNFDTPKQFLEMTDDIMNLADKIPLAADGFAEIAAAAGQAGIARQEIKQFSNDAAEMGVAFDMAAKQAGGSMVGMRTIFKLTQDQVVDLGDSVNYLSNNMDAKASDVINILNRVGGTGKLIGMTGQQVAALGATFLALERPPEVASTGINALLLKMATADQQGKTFNNGLKEIGLSAGEVKRWVGEDANGALLKFLTTVRQSPDIMNTLSKLFGAEYADDIAALVGNLEVYQKALKLSGDQAGYAGSMHREYEARAATTANALQLLKNNAINTAIVFGNQLAPDIMRLAKSVGRLTQDFRHFAQEHPALTRAVVMSVVVIALLKAGIGATIFILGAFSVALGNASAGLALARTAITRKTLALRENSAAMLSNLMTSGAWARSTSTAQMQSLLAGKGATTFGLALSGLRVQLAGAATAAWSFLAPLLANPITWVVIAVVALAAAFIHAWRTSQQFRDGVLRAIAPLKEAWAGLQAEFASLWNALVPAGSRIAVWLSDLQARFGSVWNAITFGAGYAVGFILTLLIGVGARILAAVTDMFGGMLRIITGTTNFIVGLFTGNMDKMRLGATQVFSGILQITRAAFGWIVQLVVRFGPQVLHWFVVALQAVRSYAVSAWAALKVVFAAAITALVTVIKAFQARGLAVFVQAFNAIKNFFGGLWAQFRDMGAHIIDGLVQGIKGKINGAVQTVKDAGSAIKQGFMNVLNMHSPSRVFAEYGGFLMQGVAIGIRRDLPQALTATTKAASSIMAAGVLVAPTIASSGEGGWLGRASAPSRPVIAASAKPSAERRPSRSFAGATFNFTVSPEQSKDAHSLFAAFAELLQDHEEDA